MTTINYKRLKPKITGIPPIDDRGNLSRDHTYVGPVIIANCEFFLSVHNYKLQSALLLYTCMCKPLIKAMHAKMLERNSFAMQLTLWLLIRLGQIQELGRYKH